MFRSYETIKKLNNKIWELQLDNNQLKAEVINYKSYLKEIEEAQCSATFLLNFDQMNVFSIERIFKKNDLPRTVIGHRIGAEIKEWYLQCSLEVHEDICNQYLEWLNKNAKTRTDPEL